MTAIFGELRRRGVLGALAAYGVVAAGALQLADIVVHSMDLPGWSLRALIWLGVAGFVATGIVSWFYDLTRRGFVRTAAPVDRAPTPGTPRPPTVPTPQPPQVPHELGAGALLAGRYRIEKEIGKGGMGRVLSARDERLGRRVAVKVVTSAHDPARIQRFEQEARTAGALEHPNVLAVYDLGEQDGVPFLVTELLEGHTLRTVIGGARLPPAQVQNLALQLARGLAAAHARGIVHRDLKPENLFLTHDGRLKILDFGLARLAADEGQGPTLTMTGAIFGTPGYLSPEQARGERAGAPSDVFSAGAVIHELLTGRRAFPGATLIEAGHATLHSDPAPLGPEVPAPFAAVVKRALEKDPARRFASGADLARALEALEPGAPVTLPPQPKSWRRSTALMVALATLGLGVALASGARLLRTAKAQRASRTHPFQIPEIPAIGSHPRAPTPPTPPAVDGEQIERDVQKQMKVAVPRAGMIGLLAGVHALDRAHHTDRAEDLLRKSRWPQARLELFLLQRSHGRGSQAADDLRAWARSTDDEDWPRPLVRAFLGEIKSDAAIAAASDSDERCEAWYYLGRLRTPEDPELARVLLGKATAEDCDQADFARQELDALQRR
ncbi:MAG TPA: serine/threonine-protein kinase [Myxococcales bacterium]|nr:serine/threonine-protein kinase [Myxococcales bacterium]